MEHAVELPTRFRSECAPTDGSITITDKKTGRTTTVGLTYYGAVVKSLNELFEAEKVEAPLPAGEQAKLPEELVSSPGSENSSDNSSGSKTAAKAKIAPKAKEATPRKNTPQTKSMPRKADTAESVVAVPTPNGNKAAPKAKSSRKSILEERKTTTKKTAKMSPRSSTLKAAPGARQTAEIIQGKGFKLVPRADTNSLAYNIIGDSGETLGSVWQHQDSGRFHVDPANTEKFGPTDHTSLPAAKARVFVISR